MNKIQELKGMAVQIRKLKKEIKDYQREHNDCHPWRKHQLLYAIRRDFRYSHIVYCMLRGRTMEQIENKTKTKTGNEIDMTSINSIMEEYKEPIIESIEVPK